MIEQRETEEGGADALLAPAGCEAEQGETKRGETEARSLAGEGRCKLAEGGGRGSEDACAC